MKALKINRIHFVLSRNAFNTWPTDRAQQIAPLRLIPPHGGIFGVQRVTAGDKGYNAARTYPVQRFSEEIVVDAEIQPVILPVIDGIV